MAKPVLTVRPEMEIRYCARLFENFGISHAPVVENGEIVGMVSYYRLVLHGLLPDLHCPREHSGSAAHGQLIFPHHVAVKFGRDDGAVLGFQV